LYYIKQGEDGKKDSSYRRLFASGKDMVLSAAAPFSVCDRPMPLQDSNSFYQSL
jgi:hypothetical protein